MTDLSGRKWDYNKNEKYVIQYLEDRGYEVTIKKRFVSKDIFSISKDNLTYGLELPFTVDDSKVNCKKMLEQFERNFQTYKELAELRKQVELKKAE